MSDFNYSGEKLIGTVNFPIWYSTICEYLRSKKCERYILKDVLSSYNKNEFKENPNMKNAYEESSAKDALASSIITANVSDKIKFLIKDCNTAFDKMTKIKELYEADESTNYGMWFRQLYSIRAKSILETMEAINEIINLFSRLKDKSIEPPLIEKLSIMYEALPKELQNIIKLNSSDSVDDFYKEIKDKYTLLNYRKNRENSFCIKLNNRLNPYKINNYDNQINERNDPMDLDNLENKINEISYITHRNKPSGIKHCVICDKQGHLAMDCYYNPCGTNRRNNYNINNNNNSNKNNHNPKRNSNGRNNKRNTRKRRSINNNNPVHNNHNNTIYNIESYYDTDYTPCYEELAITHGTDIENIEYENPKNNENKGCTKHNFDQSKCVHVTNQLN